MLSQMVYADVRLFVLIVCGDNIAQGQNTDLLAKLRPPSKASSAQSLAGSAAPVL
jgi:hypothetical protein